MSYYDARKSTYTLQTSARRIYAFEISSELSDFDLIFSLKTLIFLTPEWSDSLGTLSMPSKCTGVFLELCRCLYIPEMSCYDVQNSTYTSDTSTHRIYKFENIVRNFWFLVNVLFLLKNLILLQPNIGNTFNAFQKVPNMFPELWRCL